MRKYYVIYMPHQDRYLIITKPAVWTPNIHEGSTFETKKLALEYAFEHCAFGAVITIVPIWVKVSTQLINPS